MNEFEKWADQYNHDSDEWEDMSRETVFNAGMGAARETNSRKIDSHEIVDRLNGASRQFRHNSDERPGFVFGYDKHEIDGLVSDLIAARAQGGEAVPQPDKWKKITPAMIDAGAQRLVRWDNNCVWPDSWSAIDVAAARQDAERVLRSALSVTGGVE